MQTKTTTTDSVVDAAKPVTTLPKPTQGQSSAHAATSSKPGYSNVQATHQSANILAVANDSEFDEHSPFEYESSTVVDASPVVVHGRLRAHLPFWQSIVTDKLVLDMIQHGVTLPWDEQIGEPSTFCELNHGSCMRYESFVDSKESTAHLKYESFVDSAIADLDATGVSEIWNGPALPHCISPLGVVERNGKLRLICSLVTLNRHIKCPSFSYESLSCVRDIFKPNDWLVSWDLKSRVSPCGHA